MKKTQKGFTLIELLIVIAIIGILAGVILVSTSSAKNKATASATKQTLASLKTAMATCCSDPTASFNTTEGNELCTAGTIANLPTAAQLKASTVSYGGVQGCGTTDPTLTVTLTGHPMGAAGTGCNQTWTIKVFGGLTVPSGC